MESVDVDWGRYQQGRCVVDLSERGFAPEIAPRLGVDSDRLVIGHDGRKIARDLVCRDGSEGRHMERGELGKFWHGSCGRSDLTNLFIAVCRLRNPLYFSEL